MDCFVAALLAMTVMVAHPSEQLRLRTHLSSSPDGGDLLMGRYLLLWLLGVPIPILVLIYAFGGLH
jgi:hypothetical protein